MFIVIEGSNGSGKGTLIKSLEKELRKEGFDIALTREPGGTPGGENIRNIVLSKEMTDEMELTLFSASRILNVLDVIVPAIKKDKIVICDRFDGSTYAFQHYARGIDYNKVKESIDSSLNGINPDLYILLDLPAKDGLERAESRKSQELDKMELQNIAFLEKARMGFLDIASKDESYFVIDANLSRSDILEKALNKIKTIIKDNNLGKSKKD